MKRPVPGTEEGKYGYPPNNVNGRPLRATQGRPMMSQRWMEQGPSQVVCPDRYSVRSSYFSVGFPRRWAAKCCLVYSAR